MEGLRNAEHSPTEQFLAAGLGGQAHWPQHVNYNFDDDHDHHHAKKSVVAKVKDKAMKWRNALSKKKHTQNKDNETPERGVSLDEEDDEEDPEYHGAPMYESEKAPDVYKETVSQSWNADTLLKYKPPIPQHPDRARATKHVDELPIDKVDKLFDTSTPQATAFSGKLYIPKNMPRDLDEEECAGGMTPPSTPVKGKRPTLEARAVGTNRIKKSSSWKALTETVSEMLRPAYSVVSDAANSVVSNMQRPTVEDEISAKIKHDKGVSVKEYVLQKLQPGEDDKALSEVIIESMNPRKTNRIGGEKGVVEKVRDAVYSLLRKEDITGSSIPVSTYPQEVNAEEAGPRKIEGY